MKKVTVLTLCSVFLFCMSCVDIKMTKGKLLEASKTIAEKELTISNKLGSIVFEDMPRGQELNVLCIVNGQTVQKTGNRYFFNIVIPIST